MKTYILSLLAILLILSLVVSFASCAAQDPNAAAAVTATLAEITKDGAVTDEELGRFREILASSYGEASPWPGIATAASAVVGSLVAGFFGLRYMPNSAIVGPQEAAALNKAAGIT